MTSPTNSLNCPVVCVTMYGASVEPSLRAALFLPLCCSGPRISALASRTFSLAAVLLSCCSGFVQLWSPAALLSPLCCSSGLAAVLLLSRCPLSILCCSAAGVAQLRSGLVHVCSPAALVLRCSGLDAVLLASHSSLSMLCSCTAAASASQ